MIPTRPSFTTGNKDAAAAAGTNKAAEAMAAVEDQDVAVEDVSKVDEAAVEEATTTTITKVVATGATPTPTITEMEKDTTTNKVAKDMVNTRAKATRGTPTNREGPSGTNSNRLRQVTTTPPKARAIRWVATTLGHPEAVLRARRRLPRARTRVGLEGDMPSRKAMKGYVMIMCVRRISMCNGE